MKNPLWFVGMFFCAITIIASFEYKNATNERQRENMSGLALLSFPLALGSAFLGMSLENGPKIK